MGQSCRVNIEERIEIEDERERERAKFQISQIFIIIEEFIFDKGCWLEIALKQQLPPRFVERVCEIEQIFEMYAACQAIKAAISCDICNKFSLALCMAVPLMK